MRRFLVLPCAVAAVSSPAGALPHDPSFGTRPGAFAGATLKIPLGSDNQARPRAALTIARTRSRISDDGMIRTRIGEGIALSLTPDAKPSLTLAGARADMALGLRRQNQVEADRKLGISTGGWVAIGVGTVALVVGGLYLWADHVRDCEDRENGCS